jgi:hypothetical protein
MASSSLANVASLFGGGRAARMLVRYVEEFEEGVNA